jgi:16S rRNA (guanine527-N7)-methyltransferase
MFHVKHEAWAQRAQEVGASLDPRDLDRLATFVDLIRAHAIPLGMVAPSDGDRLWERHIVDSLRAVPLLRGSTGAADLGSGAGLPGVPLAVALPGCELSLIEHRRQRVGFLEMVLERLNLGNARVVGTKAQRVSAGAFEAVVARAFGPPAATWGASGRLLRPGGRLIYWAGASFDPVAEAPDGVSLEVMTSGVANTGPLVIMTPR